MKLSVLAGIQLICALVSITSGSGSRSDDVDDEYYCADIIDKQIADIQIASNYSQDRDEQSHLERLWQKASSFVYSLAQPSDQYCKFNYHTGTCSPRCEWYSSRIELF
jgi:hypothetical protein